MMKAQLKFAGRILESNVRRLDLPYKVLLSLTYWCNSKCQACNIWQRKPQNELSTEEVKLFFAKNSHFSWVNLTGGEIFLRKDLPEILSIVREECKDLLLLNFATNGLQPARTERILRDMPKHSTAKTVVTVSVDGPPDVNDVIRGVAGDFEKSVETFKRIRALDRDDVEVYFGSTLSDLNAGKLGATFDALKKHVPDLRYTDLHINVAHQSAHYYGNEGVALVTRDEIKRDVAEHYARQPRLALSTVRYLEKRFLRHLQNYLVDRKNPVPCKALSSSCFVDSFGTVFPCITYDKPLGNLRDVDFDLKKLWQRDEVAKVREEIKADRCPNCWTPCEAYPSLLGGLFS